MMLSIMLSLNSPILILLVMGLVSFLLLSKRSSANQQEKSIRVMSITETFGDTLEKLRNTGKYSDQVLKWIEQIYRIETRNFESLQFLQTYTAGMEAVKGSKPPYYGWSKYHFGSIIPSGTISMKENQTGIQKDFIVFDTLPEAMTVLANFLNKYGRAGRWFSTIEEKQEDYERRIAKIDTPIFDDVKQKQA